MLYDILDSCSAFIAEARADLASFSAVGSGLTPIAAEIPEISMLRERVEINVYPGHVVVEALFEMQNFAEACSIDVGFPVIGGLRHPWICPGELKDFAVFMSMTEIDLANYESKAARIQQSTIRQSLNSEYPMWQVWSQDFGADAKHFFVVRYRVELRPYHRASPMPFTYVLRTGNFWRDSIGHAEVEVALHEFELDSIVAIEPKPHTWDQRRKTLTWSWSDFTPETDLTLVISGLRSMAIQFSETIAGVQIKKQQHREGAKSAPGQSNPKLLTDYLLLDVFQLNQHRCGKSVVFPEFWPDLPRCDLTKLETGANSEIDSDDSFAEQRILVYGFSLKTNKIASERSRDGNVDIPLSVADGNFDYDDPGLALKYSVSEKTTAQNIVNCFVLDDYEVRAFDVEEHSMAVILGHLQAGQLWADRVFRLQGRWREPEQLTARHPWVQSLETRHMLRTDNSWNLPKTEGEHSQTGVTRERLKELEGKARPVRKRGLFSWFMDLFRL